MRQGPNVFYVFSSDLEVDLLITEINENALA